MKICSVTDCGREVKARGWCNMHYVRWRKYGDINYRKIQHFHNPEEAFEARTEWQGDCLIWTGATDSNGYGQMRFNGSYIGAHRYAWEREHGPIPVGGYIDHKDHCNTSCVNVLHLRMTTNQQNTSNLSGVHKNNTSGHRGVSWNKRKKRWHVRVWKNYVCHHIGYYDDLEEAAKVAEETRKELFGEYAGRG